MRESVYANDSPYMLMMGAFLVLFSVFGFYLDRVQAKTAVKEEPVSPQKGGRKKKVEEPEEVWKWYVSVVWLMNHIGDKG